MTVLPETAARILLVKLGGAAVNAPTSSCSGPSSGIVGWLNDLLECFLRLEKIDQLGKNVVRNNSLVNESFDPIPVVGQVRMRRVPRFTSVGTRVKSPKKLQNLKRGQQRKF